jgi:DUF218 domain
MGKTIHRKKIPKIRFIKRQETWMLTIQGWLIAIACIIGIIFLTITHIHPFLAISTPIKAADALVVEGWLPDYALQQALTEFRSGSYRQIITTGGTIDQGSYLIGYKNFAELSAATLKTLGLEAEKIVVVPAPRVIKDRSYASAAQFRHWLSNSSYRVKSINLFSLGAHTRRSWVLYKNILTPQIQVGAIAGQNRDYDPNKWWVSSEGVRTVIGEAIAYIYARFLNPTG